jgi:5-methylcytosine-specific restriction endonuclease McrA
MSLLPAEALEPNFPGSIDVAVDDHLRGLGINVSDDGRRVLRDTCINARRLYGLSKLQARNQTVSIAGLRGNPKLYQDIFSRQNGRCIWCGVSFSSSHVRMTLDHVTPKHLGDDPPDGRNWALSCGSCNIGKDDAFAWSARPEAHDFIGRNDISVTGLIGLKHRWSILMRGRLCEQCGSATGSSELWVYRRIRTGLPVPVNCGVICEGCAQTRKPEILSPLWIDQEKGRGVLSA